MARKLPSSRLPWHPGYPFKPRGGKTRRAGSVVVLAALMTVIGGYWYLTDSDRVRKFAEEQMSKALGGKVKIASARVSIFEGLRLDGVNVYVDKKPKTPDSLLFSAESLQVTVPVGDLMQGDLSHATFLAFEPRVRLVKDETGVYNGKRFYEGLQKRSTTRASTEEHVSLPQIILRGGKVEFGEVVAGKERMETPLALEGTLNPDPEKADVYTFAASARTTEGKTPATVSGQLDLGRGEYFARAFNVDLQLVRPALPPEVRAWIDRHELTGTVEFPEVNLSPDRPGEGKRTFRVVAHFAGGGMSLKPDELRPKDLPPLPSGLPAIRFTDVQGELAFTENGISLSGMSVRHEGNEIKVSGRIDNYTPDSPFEIEARCDKLHVPESPAVLPSLPPEVREVWDRFLPRGDGSFEFKVARDAAGHIAPNGKLTIVDGQMKFFKFPMPVYGITGEIVVTNEAPGKTRLAVKNVRGHGAKGTPNETADLRVDGSMFPLEGGSGVDFVIHGDHVVSERNLISAMPETVQEALEKFAPRTPEEIKAASTRPSVQAGKDEDGDDLPPVPLNLAYPEFGGSFTATIHRDQGKVGNWRWPIDIDLEHGTGAFEEFPYPLDNVSGKMGIRSGYVTLDGMTTTRGDAHLTVNGRVSFGEREAKNKDGKLLYALKLEGGKIPVDSTLIGAIPPDQRQWLERLGLTGKLDLSGDVTGLNANYTLGLKAYDGTLKPKGSTWVASDVEGNFTLTPKSFTIVSATGKRGNAPIAVTGLVDWASGAAKVTMDVDARTLPLDRDLRSALPDDGRSGWDSVKPEGSADVRISILPDQPATITIAPLGLSATPSVMPVKLTDVRGLITLRDDGVHLSNLTARHGDGTLALSGSGSSRSRGKWDVKLSGRNLVIGEAERKALPSMIRDTVAALAASGSMDVDVRTLRFTPGVDTPPGSKTPPGGGADVDFDVSLHPINMTMSLGVEVKATSGRVEVNGQVRDDRLIRMNGLIDVPTAMMANRELTKVLATVRKEPDQAGMTFRDISAVLAGGILAGDAAVAFPDNAPIAYSLDLKLQGADMEALVGKVGGASVSGQMSASLRLEQPNVDDPSTRRGSGDITVLGEHLAKIPVLLGFVQIANLSLPTTFGGSFNSAGVRYNMDGGRVNFETISLRGPGVTIEGKGSIDLDARVVLLTFWTRPELLKVPVFGDLIDRGARELLTMEVRGSIDNPKIGPRSFESFSTTVDRIEKGR